MKNSSLPVATAFLIGTVLGVLLVNASPALATFEGETMKIQYLEIVTSDVDGTVAAYAAAHDVQFGEPVAELGGARTAPLADGGFVGIRAPLRDDEAPVVRPYWLVPDIAAAHDAAVEAGGQVAHPPLEIPGRGTFAIYHQGGNDHGLWQL